MARNIRQTIYNLTKHRVGSTSNYTDLDSSGRLTMAGTGRVRKSIWIPATDWLGVEPNMFANAYNVTLTSATCTPTPLPMSLAYGDSGSNPQVAVLAASAGCGQNARAATVFLAPRDAATTGSVGAVLYYTTKLDMDETGCAQVFRLHGQYVGTGGSPEVGNSTSLLKGGSMAGQGLGVIEELTIGSLPSFSRTASPLVFLQLSVENSSACSYVYQADSGSSEEAILGLELTYTADALGTASAE